MQEKEYSVGEVAAIFQCAAQTIRNISGDGRISPPKRTTTGHRRYTAKHIEEAERYFFPMGKPNSQ